MFKVSIRVMNHTDLLHHPARGEVVGDGEGDNLFESHFLESESQQRQCSLGGIAVVPESGQDSPADFYAGTARKESAWDVQAYTADEKSLPGQLRHPHREAIDLEPLLEAVDHHIAVGTIKGTGHVTIERGVGHHLGERLTVIFAPSAKQESFSSDRIC